MTVKHRKEFLLDESTLSYIEKFKDTNHFSSLTSALAEIIQEHQHRNDVQASKVLVEQLAKQVAKELEAPLTRIRLGVNNADRNSDITLLVLNTLMGYQQYKTFISDDTPQLAQAKEFEKERIANFRQKRLDEKARKERSADSDFEQLTIPEDDLISGDTDE